jgi:hypothetical protein
MNRMGIARSIDCTNGITADFEQLHLKAFNV